MSEEAKAPPVLCGVESSGKKCGREVEVGRGGVLVGSKGTPECAMHHQRSIRNHPEAGNPEPLRGTTPAREEKVTVRFTPAELALVERLAAEMKMDPATWCHLKLRKAIELEVTP